LKEGDLITIANEGKKIEGQFGEQDVFLVKLPDNSEGNMAINQKSLNNFIDAFGEDSVNWIGKKVKVWKIRAMVSGKLQNIVYLSHPDAKMTDEGDFYIDGKDDTQEITGEDVGF
jgi:hypothetical protein